MSANLHFRFVVKRGLWAMTRTSFQALPRLLKPNGAFVLSITRPAFNNASTVHVLEEVDDEGEIKTIYSVKTSRYMTHSHAKGVALRSQPRPQMYFERPLQYYLNLGFRMDLCWMASKNAPFLLTTRRSVR